MSVTAVLIKAGEELMDIEIRSLGGLDLISHDLSLIFSFNISFSSLSS
jgi:hypothetical protein